MSSRRFLLALLVILFDDSNFLSADRITIGLNGNGSSITDLQSYLADLHVAVSSVQYTANVSARMLIGLMDKLKRDEVNCQCGTSAENSRNNAWNDSSIGRLDYRRTSPVVSHKLHSRPLKWNDARKSCKLEGAELVTVESIDEAQLLAKILREARIWDEEVNETVSAFIGVHSQFEANDWINVRTGESIPATLWSVQVSNSSSSSDPRLHRCAVLTVHSNLNATDCNQPRPYLCELRLLP